MKTIWGVSGYSHDASICVLQDGLIKFASSTERYSRLKNDKFFNKNIIEDCLQFGYPDELVWYENPYKKLIRTLLIDKKIYFKNIKKIFSEYYNITCKFSFCNHHKAHLLSSLLTSPFDVNNSLGVVIDTVGEFMSLSIWDIKSKADYRLLCKHTYPDSLGLFYSSITDLVGLKPQEDEYILMGMSSYGSSLKYYDFFKNMFFDNIHLKINLRNGCRGIFSEEEIKAEKFNIALGAQLVYEEILKTIISTYLKRTGYNKIIMSGGCALNCRANSLLLDMVDRLWIFPNPGDSGAALGAALNASPVNVELKNVFLGHDVGINKNIELIVDCLVNKGVVGVMNGRAEFGPRALGNRSILADPRVLNIQDMVNDIKGRERFRPFAPAVLESFAQDYFFIPKNQNLEYMQYVFRNKTKTIPGVIHIDNSSRVQTVNDNNPFLNQILLSWQQKTGCPILLNTSLNVKGKPLLNSLRDIKEFEGRDLNIITP